MRCSIRLRHAAALLTVVVSLGVAPLAAADDNGLLDRKFEVDIAAQEASTAVIELSKQAGVQVAMAGGSLDGAHTDGLHGAFSLRDALTQLLQGTPYAFQQTAANTITVTAAAAAATPSAPQAAQGPEPLPTIP